MKKPVNVLGGPIAICSQEPLTGWFRDGCCNTDDRDMGSHTVCVLVTIEFLMFLRSIGNDLITPSPPNGFPGLKPGDSWCVCANSWYQAYEMGKACQVKLESTHEAVLDIIPLEALVEYAIAAEA